MGGGREGEGGKGGKARQGEGYSLYFIVIHDWTTGYARMIQYCCIMVTWSDITSDDLVSNVLKHHIVGNAVN